MRDRHLVISPGSPNVETVPAMLPNLKAAERDERCVWCGRTREDHEESREPGADAAPLAVAVGAAIGYAGLAALVFGIGLRRYQRGETSTSGA